MGPGGVGDGQRNTLHVTAVLILTDSPPHVTDGSVVVTDYPPKQVVLGFG